jgi:hypothetical protein
MMLNSKNLAELIALRLRMEPDNQKKQAEKKVKKGGKK